MLPVKMMPGTMPASMNLERSKSMVWMVSPEEAALACSEMPAMIP